MRVQGPAMCLSQARGRFHPETLDGAAADDWVRGCFMSPLGEMMPLTSCRLVEDPG